MKNLLLTRRTLFTGAAISSVGLLAACGGNQNSASTSAESASALGVGEDIAKLISMNPKKREELKEGGEVKLALNSLGPDFNTANNNGNMQDTVVAMSSISTSGNCGLWQSDFEGKMTPNPDFCESFKTTTEDGKQVHRIKLNPKAKFNDGTPIDIEVLKVTAKILGGSNKEYNLILPGAYEFVKEITQDGDAIKVTMSQPYYPIDALYGRIIHPALEDVKVFNDGFVNNPHPEWQAGPFKLEDWNSTEKRMTVVPNDKWWGEKPVLDRIIFRQMEQSAQRAAFKNGELDAVVANTNTAYKDVEGTEGTEVRRGQKLYAAGVDMFSGRLPVELRKAIMASVDRKALADIRFNGLNWAEETPGSMMLMPFSEYYENNFNEVVSKWNASQILEDAGYNKDGDYFKKDGKNAKFAVTTFGDDPVQGAMAQTLIQQMKSAGIECTIDNQPDANFGSILGNMEYDYSFAGFTVSADATLVASQYYLQENGGANMGDEEIDKMIYDMQKIEDNVERNKKCNEIERLHLERYAAQMSAFNGPIINVVKKELANFGPSLLGDLELNPSRWTILGWTK